MNLFFLLLCILSFVDVLPLQTSSALRFINYRKSVLCCKFDDYSSKPVENAPGSVEVETSSSENALRPYYAAAMSGLATSAIVILSRRSIAMIDAKFTSKFPLHTPILAGALIGGLHLFEEKVSKPSFTKLSLQDRPFLSWRKFLLRWIGFVVSIGSGLSVGIAGPAAEIGMVITYFICQLLNTVTPVSELLPLLLAGAGAGLAANFNAPVSGALYSLEVTNQLIYQDDRSSIPADKRKGYLLMAIFAAVLYVRNFRFFTEFDPLLKFVKNLGGNTVVEFLSLIAVGLSSGMVFHLYSILRSFFQQQYLNLPLVVRPILAGTFCGIAAVAGFPQTLSHGFSTINSINSGRYSFWNLLYFLAIKLCLVASSSVANIPGGQLAPMLFIGASAGAMCHHIFSILFQSIGFAHSVSTFSLIGAAAFLSAHFKSPLFATVLIFELTKSWELTVGSAFAAIVSDKFSRWFTKTGKKVKE